MTFPRELLVEGWPKQVIVGSYPLEETAEAHRYVEKGIRRAMWSSLREWR
jgi:hypothetical protein